MKLYNVTTWDNTQWFLTKKEALKKAKETSIHLDAQPINSCEKRVDVSEYVVNKADKHMIINILNGSGWASDINEIWNNGF